MLFTVKLQGTTSNMERCKKFSAGRCAAKIVLIFQDVRDERLHFTNDYKY